LAAATQAQTRPRREREEEVLVWPDLVFIEFIAAVLFTATFTIISALVNAPLHNHANPEVTPNPSKAPWYFMNLQELLLHMDPALAGVIVPTIALILLAAIPYIDRNQEGQGVWFGTPNSVKITIFSAIFAAFFTILLIVFNQGFHAEIYESVTGDNWPVGAYRPGWLPDVGIVNATWDLLLSRNTRAIQTEWHWSVAGLAWPDDFTRIPMPLNLTSWPLQLSEHGEPPPHWYQDLPGWLTGLYWYDLNLNLPAFIVEIFIPTVLMVTLPIVMIFILWRIALVNTRRDVMIALFTGFIVVYWVLTLSGAAFRGEGMDLVPPWQVPKID
jgi:menaquinol-cytochrome c reductase cytochrome b/c subunit